MGEAKPQANKGLVIFGQEVITSMKEYWAAKQKVHREKVKEKQKLEDNSSINEKGRKKICRIVAKS